MADYVMRTSIHGRRLGISSSGAVITSYGSTGNQSTGFVAAAIMKDSTGTIMGPHDEPVVSTTSTGGATLTFSGVANINTSATAATFLLTAPTAGRMMEVYILSSASALTFGGTSTSQVFMKVGGGAAGSTTLTLTDVSLAGQALKLRGLSATQYGVLHGSTVIQA